MKRILSNQNLTNQELYSCDGLYFLTNIMWSTMGQSCTLTFTVYE